MKKDLKVLVIEDSADDADLMVAQLEIEGYTLRHERVWTESMVCEALARGPWDIILSDDSFPGFSGARALQLVKAAGIAAPFILVSGVASESGVVDAIRAGACDFVVKGQLGRLGRAVARALSERETSVALHETEVFVQRVVESSRDCIKVLDDEGRILSMNQSGMTKLGIPDLAAVRGRTWSELFHGSGREAAEEAVASARRGGVGRFLALLPAGDGHPLWWDSLVSPIAEGPAGGGRRLLAVSRDVTEQRAAMEEREHLLRQAQRANKLKDDFLAMLSHELRTPLNAIIGHGQLLSETDPETPEFRESLDAIMRNGRVQAKLIEDLLDVARITSGKLTLTLARTDVAAVGIDALSSVRMLAEEKGVRIETVLAPGLFVHGDRDRLQQVLWNLLSNAIKFTPPGGCVTLRATADGEDVVLSVEDTGKGIDADFLPHVFERFRQEDESTTRRYGGLGLGLAIAHHVTSMHGGTIAAASDGRGAGATFSIRLPALAPEPPVAGEKGARPDESVRARLLAGARVLVVEDHEASRELTRRILTSAGAAVKPTDSVAHAFAALAAESFDVIVSDISMPDEDGFELVRRLRTWESAEGRVPLPVIALTAFAEAESRARVLASGFQSFLTKPVRPAELVREVEALTVPSRARGRMPPPSPPALPH